MECRGKKGKHREKKRREKLKEKNQRKEKGKKKRKKKKVNHEKKKTVDTRTLITGEEAGNERREEKRGKKGMLK